MSCQNLSKCSSTLNGLDNLSSSLFNVIKFEVSGHPSNVLWSEDTNDFQEVVSVWISENLHLTGLLKSF